MIAIPSFGTWVWLVLSIAVLAAILWFVPAVLARRSHWEPPTQKTFVQLFRSPIVTAVLAVAAIELDQQFWMANPGGLPSELSPMSVVVIVELVIVWALIAAVTLAVRRHLTGAQARRARSLEYGIYGAGLLGVVLILLSSPEVPRLAGGIWAVIGFVSGLLVTYLVVHIVDLGADRYLTALAHHQPSLETLYRFLRRGLMLVVVLVGVAVSAFVNFPTASAALTSLVLAAGFLSIVVGLAAQATLSNLIAGAMISLAQPFEIGDAVVYPYPNGDWCFVEDIRLNFTVLRTWDLRRLMVPNSMFQSSVLVNYTAVDPTMLVIVYLVITYDSDVDRARQIMVEEARAHPDYQPLGNLPITHVMDYQGGGNQGAGMYGGVDLRLLSAAKDQPTAFQVEKDLLYSIRKRFQAEGIQIAYPTQRIIVEPSGAPRRAGTPRRKASDA
jgi:small-conductance mechanosensitive channel